MYNEMPIKVYSEVHIGANNQFGGVMAGLSSEAYHPGIAGVVNIAPKNPAP